MVIHVGSHLPRLPRLLTSKTAGQARSLLAASATRWLLLCGSLAGGALVAVLAYHLSANWGG